MHPDQAPSPMELPYAMRPTAGVSVEVDPVLTASGYPRASLADTQTIRRAQTEGRIRYWTEGDGALRFLQEVADKLNASPHLELQPFEVTMTWGVKNEVAQRVEEFSYHDDAEVARIVLDYADFVAVGLLAKLVRGNRWERLERQGREPVPLNYPTYTGGQNHRAGPFDNVIGRKSEAVAREELARFRLENPWVR
jgi:hypothetical protein